MAELIIQKKVIFNMTDNIITLAPDKLNFASYHYLLSGDNKLLKFWWLYFDLIICYYSIFLSHHEIISFNMVLDNFMKADFDIVKYIYIMLFWIINISTFPSLAIFSFLEMFFRKTYFIKYLLSLLTLIFPFVILIHYTCLLILDEFGIILVIFNLLIFPLALMISIKQIKLNQTLIFINRRKVYVNIIARLFIIAWIISYLYSCYNIDNYKGYLRNNLIEDNSNSTISSEILYSIHCSFDKFNNQSDDHNNIENFMAMTMFAKLHNDESYQDFAEKMKNNPDDQSIGVYHGYLSLPMKSFASIHPYRVLVCVYKYENNVYFISNILRPHYL